MKKFLGIAAYVAIVCFAIPSMAFAQAVVSIDPAEMKSPEVGKQVVVNVNIKGGANVAGYQFTLTFDATALKFISIANADYLPAGAFAVPPAVGAGKVTLAATSLTGPAAGADGTLAKATFEVVAVKDSTLGLTELALSDPVANSLPVTTTGGKIAGAPAPANQAPVAAIKAADKATVGASIPLDGGDSKDDSTIASYAWDFGDSSTGTGKSVSHAYAKAGDFTVTLTVTDDGKPDGKPLTGKATLIIKVAEAPKPVITEHKPGVKVLWLTTNIPVEKSPAKGFIAIWEGEMDAKAGTFIEYQVKFSHFTVHRIGGVFVHAADGTVSGPVAADTEQDWHHRKVSLDALAGKKIVAITLGTDNGANPDNAAGPFNMLVDNVQITDGTNLLTEVWVGKQDIGGNASVAQAFGDAVGIDNFKANVINEGDVAVHPQGKVITTWGRLKGAQ
jgi:hypothetical protein